MSQTTESPLGRPRRRQAERRAETRRRIIDAPIECLYRLGYSATTITRVAQQAGVSRSIIAYHIASKADLMVNVRDAVQQDEHDALVAFEQRTSAKDLVDQLERLVLMGMRKEPAMAVNEILLASRGDPELRAKLRAKEKEIDVRSSAYYLELLGRGGFAPPQDHFALEHLTVATIRGLAITELVQGDDADVEASIELYQSLIRPLFRRAK
jgi:AcrR family transcriptional regulator